MEQVKINEVRGSNGTLHFSSLSREEAERFVDYFDAENGVVLELYELTITPTDHTNVER